MSPRRSKLEIWLTILNVINNGTSKPIRIMYEANISWSPLQRILRSMLNQNLVEDTIYSAHQEKQFLDILDESLNELITYWETANFLSHDFIKNLTRYKMYVFNELCSVDSVYNDVLYLVPDEDRRTKNKYIITQKGKAVIRFFARAMDESNLSKARYSIKFDDDDEPF